MAQELGKSFITYFYQSYDGDRTALQGIYVCGIEIALWIAGLLHADLRGPGVPRNPGYYDQDCRSVIPRLPYA